MSDCHRDRVPRRGFLKLAGALITAGAAGPLLAACAGPPPPEAKPAEPTKPAAEPTKPAAAAAPTPAGQPAAITTQAGKLSFWNRTFPPHEDMLNVAISMYKKRNPKQEIDYQAQPDFSTKWRAAMAAGQAPDILIMHGTALLELTIGKQVVPITPDVMTLAEAKRDLMPETYLQSLYKGNLHALGVPDPPGDAGLVANLDHLQEAGLKFIPAFENVAQMLEYGRKLVKKEKDAVVRAGLMITGDGNNPIYWLSYICDLGGRFFDNSKQQFTLQTPEAEQTMQFFYDIIWKERLDDPALGNNSSNALGQELAALAFKWPEFVPYSRKAFPGLNLGFIAKPGFKLGKAPIFNHSDTWNLIIWSGTKNRDAAIDFFTYAKTREVQRPMLTANPGMSPLKAINFDPNESFWVNGPGAYMAPILDSITKGQYRYYGPFGNMDTLQSDTMWPVMNDLFQKKSTVKEALQTMEAKLNEEMKKYRDKYTDLDPVQIYWDGIPADLMQGIPVKSGA